MTHFIKMGDVQSLFLGEITEPQVNSLKIIVHPAVYDTEIKPVMLGDIQVTTGREYWADTTKKTEIEFDSYIGYSIRNESNCPYDPDEVYVGKLLRVYSHSKYLEFIKASTFILPNQEGKFKHFGIICEDHIIDVISVDDPRVSE
jgi:hypothetical protein